MQLEHSAVLAARREDVWTFLMDVPNVARCMPGVDELKRLEDDRYAGRLTIKVGPIQLGLRGVLSIGARDQAAGRAVMLGEASDPRVGGGVNATLVIQLADAGDRATELKIATTARLMGRLGEFGQGIIKRKADQMMESFTKNLQAALDQPLSAPPAGGG